MITPLPPDPVEGVTGVDSVAVGVLLPPPPPLPGVVLTAVEAEGLELGAGVVA